MSFFVELKRRNVYRAGAAYVVVSWLIIQVVETIFPAFGLGDSAVRTIIIILSIGFVPVLVSAWAFELTPGGLKRESEIDRSSPLIQQMDKRLDRLIMIVLALGLGYFAVDKFIFDPARDELNLEKARQEGRSDALVESFGEQSIAVLAFQDMSPNKDQEYLSDGIAEELLNLLARIPELRVVSRSSAFSFKGMDLAIPEIAKRLNVAHVLEGSVRKDGNRVRITTQLIEARSDTHLWSENYDRKLDDIFDIQDEVAANVVEQLKITLLGQSPKTDHFDPDAYALMLQARHLSHQNNAVASQQSTTLLKHALEIDPNIPRAWFLLSMNYQNSVGMGLRTMDEAYALSIDVLQRALAIDPEYAPAVADLGWVAMMYENDLVKAAKYFNDAFALEPANLTVISNAAILLSILDRVDEAIAVTEYIIIQLPDQPINHSNLAGLYLQARLPEKAIASARTALMLSPDMNSPHSIISEALFFKGDYEAALEEAKQSPNEYTRLWFDVLTHHAMGLATESDKALAELIERYGKDVPYDIAALYSFRAETDHAFHWLENARQESSAQSIASSWIFENLNDDPRWIPFLESIGRSPQQLAKIEFEVILPE